jgi:hypothetical protein
LKRFWRFKSLVRYALGLERSIYWNQTIDLFSTSYTILVVCACIQMVALDWEAGPAVMFYQASAIFYFVACVFFAIF